MHLQLRYCCGWCNLGSLCHRCYGKVPLTLCKPSQSNLDLYLAFCAAVVAVVVDVVAGVVDVANLHLVVGVVVRGVVAVFDVVLLWLSLLAAVVVVARSRRSGCCDERVPPIEKRGSRRTAATQPIDSHMVRGARIGEPRPEKQNRRRCGGAFFVFVAVARHRPFERCGFTQRLAHAARNCASRTKQARELTSATRNAASRTQQA